MSRAMPNQESIRVVAGLIEGRAASDRDLKTDGASVYLKGSSIVRTVARREPNDTSTWTIELNLCGWGDTRTTRNCINSVLCRLNLPYRVGMHKHTAYLYLVTQSDEVTSPTASVKAITTLPENGWVTLPMEEA